jgi:glutathione S-transferase
MLAKVGEGELFDSRPNVKRWWNKISERSAWKSVLAMK